MVPSTRPIAATKRRDDPLLPALDRLRQAAAADFAGREQDWADEITAALGKVEAAFRPHRTGAKSAEGGVLAEVDETTPTVARQADEIRDDHDDLLVRLVSLRDEIRQALQPSASAANLDVIRERVELLVTEFEKTRQAESTLLQESVNTDIGVGD